MTVRTSTAALAAGCAVAGCLSACGGGSHATPPPTLPRGLAQSLAASSDAVATALAAGDSCRAAELARRLQQKTIASINRRTVPAAFQEQLSGAVNDLVSRVVCVPPAAPPPRKHEHGKHKGHDNQNEGGD
jgi:hypothetical protein